MEDGKDSEGRPTYHTETRTRYIHHPDEWWFHTSIGTEHQFSEDSYNTVATTWDTPMNEFSITGYEICGGVRYGDVYYYNEVIKRGGGY